MKNSINEIVNSFRNYLQGFFRGQLRNIKVDIEHRKSCNKTIKSFL